MNFKHTAEIRQIFLDFFNSKGHKIIPSSSLIPKNDSTILFTNSGMNQFKNIFLGLDKIQYPRITTAQRCVRAGGKNNDLEKVGYTTRHHTFFEMLGNFSFNDYFKYDAIQYAWELLTSEKWFNLPKEKLWITVYHTDQETYDIWYQKIGIPAKRIIMIGDNNGVSYSSDNFWQMGNTGPCGPSTEIFFDRGSHIRGGLPGSIENNGERFIEIWNIVFIQYNRKNDNSLDQLLYPFVDTGMGLERITAVLQNVNSNYEIDLFRMLIHHIIKIIPMSQNQHISLKIIADHIRSSAFLISDGILPSNEGRGYVLRRIIRRGIRHCYQIGAKDNFFSELIENLIQVMEPIADDIKCQKYNIQKILFNEEKQFNNILKNGLKLLNNELISLKNNTLDGKIAFRLYDTYGFPFDLTTDICNERNIKVDTLGFNNAMEKQKNQAKKHHNFNIDYNELMQFKKNTIFSGYNKNTQIATVIALFINNKPVNTLNSKEEGIIILDKTVFYAEAGGQVGDKGMIIKNNNCYQCTFSVINTQWYVNTIIHIGKMINGTININDQVEARLNISNRNNISRNHSATHLLFSSLQQVLGKNIVQKGSLINEKYLRFDFSYYKSISSKEIYKIENIVNKIIRKNHCITINTMTLEEAEKIKTLNIINTKYNNHYIRNINIADYSIEFCCGTHITYTGNMGLFKIKNEFGIATNIRRIEAVTGQIAINEIQKESLLLKNISQLMKINNFDNLIDKIKNNLNTVKLYENLLKKINKHQINQKILNLNKKIKKIKDINLLVTQLNNTEPEQLRDIVKELKIQLKSAIIVLSITKNDKINLIVGITHNLINKINANNLVIFLAKQINGKGGGKPDIAQAGGYDIKALSKTLNSVEEWVHKQLTE